MKKLINLSICMTVVFVMLTSLASANMYIPAKNISLMDEISTPTPADTIDPTVTPDPNSVPQPSATPEATAVPTPTISLTADDPAYPLAQMVEGISVSQNITSDGKTELTFSILNNNIGNINILTSDNVSKIVKVITTTANSFIEKNGYSNDSKDEDKQDEHDKDKGDQDKCDQEKDFSDETPTDTVTPTDTAAPTDTATPTPVVSVPQASIDTVTVVDTSAQKVDIKLTGVIPSEISSQLEQAIFDRIGKTLINQTDCMIKSTIKSSSKDLCKLWNSLKIARKSHNTSSATALLTQINQATTNLNQLVDLGYSIEAYKADLKNDSEICKKDGGDKGKNEHKDSNKKPKVCPQVKSKDLKQSNVKQKHCNEKSKQNNEKSKHNKEKSKHKGHGKGK